MATTQQLLEHMIAIFHYSSLYMSCPDLIFDYTILGQICLFIWLDYNTKLKTVLTFTILTYFQQT